MCILYESYYGTSKKVAKIFGKVMKGTKVYNIKHAPKSIKKCKRLILIFSFHGYSTASNIKKYINSMKNIIGDKKVLIIGVGLQKTSMPNYLKDIRDALGREEDYLEFIEGELKVNRLTDEDTVILMRFFNKYNMEFKDMGNLNEKAVYKLAMKYREII